MSRGADVTLAALSGDPHATLAALRERDPVAWIPDLEGWLVTRRDLALEVMRDAPTYTVDDPRFTTARVVGPSMLSLDGAAHDRHRAPFAGPFRRAEVLERFTEVVAAEAARLSLVTRVEADRDSAITAGLELARTIAAKSPLAVAGAKMSLNYSRGRTVEEGLRHVALWNAGTLVSADLTAAIGARMTKQTPEFGDLDP